MGRNNKNVELKDKSEKNVHWYNYPYKITIKKLDCNNYSEPVTYVIHQP